MPGHEGSSGGDKSEGSEFKPVNVESGSCGVGSCEAESELYGTAPLLSCFFSGVVKSRSKKLFLCRYLS